MVVWNKKKSARYFWCTLVVTTIITCGAFLYFSFSAGIKQSSSSESLRDYSSTAEKLTEEECTPICDSKECIYQSKRLLDQIKPSVNPCENFNEFICGKIFEKSDPEESHTLPVKIDNTKLLKLKSMLDTIEADPESALGKMKTVYNSCMKYSSSDIQAIPTIIQFLRNLGIPGWPHLSPDFKFVDPSLTKVIGNFLLYEEYGFIEITRRHESSYDPNVQVNVSLLYKNSIYENKENPERKYLVDGILDYFQLDPETIEGIWNESEAICEAVMNLRERNNTDEEDMNSPPSFVDCTEDDGNEWKDVCEVLKILVDSTESNVTVGKNYAKISEEEFLMKNIFAVLRNFSDRSIANYLALNVLMNNLNELTLHFRLMQRKVDEEILGKHVKSKWQKCVQWISINMGLALGHEYLKKDFTVLMLQEILSLTEEHIRESVDLISLQEWMTDAIRSNVSRKVGITDVQFDRFFKILPNETRVNKFYEKFHPTDENFLQNVLDLKKHIRILDMHGLFTANEDWLRELFMVDAENIGISVVISLGYFSPPVYFPGLGRTTNLISLGMVMLHEIGHHFQETLESLTQWDPKTKDYYEENLKCLKNEYSQFRFDSIGKNLNGSRSVDENFADVFAISVIDKLIEKLTSDNSSFLLPSLSFSAKQLLYISAVEACCAVHTIKEEELFYNSAYHSPEKFRLLGMIRNSKGFAEAFDCPPGSYMNPVTKCFLLE